MRKISLALLLFIMAGPILSGCEAQSVPLSERIARDGVTEIQITYMSYGSEAKSRLTPQDADFASLLDALLAAPASKAVVEAYSPEMNASHKISLFSADGTGMVAYYDARKKLLSVTTYRQASGGDKILSFFLYDAELSTILNALEGEAVAPVEPLVEEPPLSVDSLLRAEVVQEDLAKEGQAVDYELFDYPAQLGEPFYNVQTYLDGVEGLENGYLLLVAAWGERPASGFTIDFKDIIENDYYVVRVEHDTPAEAQGTPSYPVAAALVDARLMSADKLVVFLDAEDNILNVIRLDRDFFANLPEDMPPLEGGDPMEEEEGAQAE